MNVFATGFPSSSSSFSPNAKRERTRWRRHASLGVAGLDAPPSPRVYLHQLDYRSTAALWWGIGAALAIISFDRLTKRGWFAVTLPAALVGAVLVSVVYRRTFT